MKKSAKVKLTAMPKVDPYIEGLMSKVVERLIRLEQKIDTVVSQTAARGAASGPTPNAQRPAPQAQAPQPPRRERQLYEAVCADCSKVCEVPFKPSEDRAVYCKECWARRKSQPGGGRPQPPSRPGMPTFTPVAMPAKTAPKLQIPEPPVSAPARSSAKKAKKTKAPKKAKL